MFFKRLNNIKKTYTDFVDSISRTTKNFGVNFRKFIKYIDIFYKFNNYVIGKSPIKLDNHLAKHYNLSYAKGSVITLFIFAMLFRPGFENTQFAKINADKNLIINSYTKEDVMAIDENLLGSGKRLESTKPAERPSEFTDRQMLGFGNNIDARTVISLFEEEDYNLKDIRNGKAVEPIFLSKLPSGMAQIDSIADRKKLFIKVILPLVIYENNRILEDRGRLNQNLREKNLNQEEVDWLNKKFAEYKVNNNDMAELALKMDIIPPSLALAQAAYESGWGTSRFAMEGNSLFGARTWKKGRGIVPTERGEEESFEVRSFKIIRASISSYKRNLNTHNSYKEFREARAKQREKDNTISGLKLSKYLDKYSEIGYEYSERLQKIIEQNSLTDFDDSVLSRKKKPNIV